MPRLIDADYVLSALGVFNDRENGNEHFLNGIETAKEIVENTPTVELTDEIAIEQLQASGWMQKHDYEMSRPGWIRADERLPEEHPSIFEKVYGTGKWNNAMWRTESDRVLVAIRFIDGTRTVDKGKLQEGKWRTGVSPVLSQEVTHWALWPEAPKEDENATKT